MPAKGAIAFNQEPLAEALPPSHRSTVDAAAITVAGVSKRFRTRSGELLALSGLTFEVAPNETLGVVGPSGCGKTTLLELLAGLSEPSEGGVAVAGGTEAGERLERCALMPQRDLLLPWRSAQDNAALGLELAGLSRKRARRQALPLMQRFGLERFARARPWELSGGMRQRVAFCRTLLAGKPVLLLDEPFGSLDTITRADLQSWLAQALADEPRTTVLVTHDVEEALFLCDRVLVLSARPATVKAEIGVSVPRHGERRRTVTDPAFVALRERALEALA